MGTQNTEESIIAENSDNSTQYLETSPKGNGYLHYQDHQGSSLHVATRDHIQGCGNVLTMFLRGFGEKHPLQTFSMLHI